jgi:curli biogenesis system outer membrane secretion channel CsgG
MLTAVLLFCLNFGQTQAVTSPPVQNQPSTSSSGAKVEAEIAAKLLKVRRIYVESFGDDTIVKQLQAMLITSLAESKRFIITENKEKADAILKGTGLENTSQEFHAIGDSTVVAAASGGSHSQVGGNVSNGTGSISGSSSGGFVARNLGTSDSQASTETVNDARLAVRLVSSDGDVIWATTKESKGAKYKGASADVADQIVKQLVWDLDKLEAVQKSLATK